jgi:hypothetical protein
MVFIGIDKKQSGYTIKIECIRTKDQCDRIVDYITEVCGETIYDD